MCEPRNRDNGASDLWTLTTYYPQRKVKSHGIWEKAQDYSTLSKLNNSLPGPPQTSKTTHQDQLIHVR